MKSRKRGEAEHFRDLGYQIVMRLAQPKQRGQAARRRRWLRETWANWRAEGLA